MTTALRMSSHGWAKPARRGTFSIGSINGAPDHAVAPTPVVFLRGRLFHQRRAAFRQRRDGKAVSESVRQTARPGSLLLDRERAVGLLQHHHLLSAGLPRRRFRPEERR